MECRLADNQDNVLMYMASLSVVPPLDSKIMVTRLRMVWSQGYSEI